MTSTRMRDHAAGPPAGEVRGRPGGIGRSTSPAAEQVSDDLRRHSGGFLDQRRRISALALAGVGSLGVVAAYQTGVIRHVPEPPLGRLDADVVDASGAAYRLLNTSDAALGMASYAVTLALAAMGDADRTTKRPWIPVLLGAKVLMDAVSGAFLAAEQGTKHGKFCSWCLASAASGVAMVPLAVPEARVAIRRLRGQ
jgi:hypothetical protein